MWDDIGWGQSSVFFSVHPGYTQTSSVFFVHTNLGNCIVLLKDTVYFQGIVLPGHSWKPSHLTFVSLVVDSCQPQEQLRRGLQLKLRTFCCPVPVCLSAAPIKHASVPGGVGLAAAELCPSSAALLKPKSNLTLRALSTNWVSDGIFCVFLRMINVY